MAWIPTSAVAFAIALAAAGCGADSSEQLDAQELISRGDEICAQGSERFAEVQARAPANATEASEQTERLVELATEELNSLRELRPPPELRERYDAYLEARAGALELLERGRDAAEDRDAGAYAAAQAEAAAAQPDRLALAKAVGFGACSTG